MAKCRKCNAEIPDGQELCSNCEKESNGSYPDDLLRSAVPEGAEEERPPEGFDMLFGDGETLNGELPEEGRSGYNIFEDDAAEELEFDQMLRGITQDAGSGAPAEEAGVDMPEFDAEALLREAGAAESETEGLSEETGGDAMELETEETAFPEPFEMPEPEGEAESGMPFGGTEKNEASEEEPGVDLPAMGADNMEDDIFSIPDSMGVEMEEPMQEEEDGLQEDDLTSMSEEMPAEEKTDDDILDLINSIYNSEIEEGQEPSGHSEAEEQAGGTGAALERAGGPEDIEDVFSDTLSVMNSLEDAGETDEKEAEDPGEGKKKAKKSKKGKKEKEPKEKKPGFFKRIFGNIKAERSEEEIAALKEKVVADAEAKAAVEEAKAKQAAAQKEEKKKKAAEAKTEAAKRKQEKAKQKAEAAKQKKEEKDRKKQEIQNLIDAIDEDEGRINRVGASIIFVFFVAIAAAIIIGTNVYNYSNTIANAENYFENRRYNEAYNEVAGIDRVKKEDQTFVLQVTTVMITYKQLNSFNNYYAMELYPEALDSLIKGIQRYDEYSGIASVIEVDRDMDYIRGRLTERLEEVFGLTERDARALAAIEDREEYTARVYEIAGRLER